MQHPPNDTTLCIVAEDGSCARSNMNWLGLAHGRRRAVRVFSRFTPGRSRGRSLREQYSSVLVFGRCLRPLRSYCDLRRCASDLPNMVSGSANGAANGTANGSAKDQVSQAS